MRYNAMLVMFACLAFVACEDDDIIDGCDPCPPPTRVYLDRSQMWHVLNNIELAYNQRKINPYETLLDDNFTFFLATGDVGGSVPESWGSAVEVQANANLFSN